VHKLYYKGFELVLLCGAGVCAGWRWLFIIEGAPAVLLGVAIWLFLPSRVSKCNLLTPLEQQHLQAAIDGTMPQSCLATPGTCPTTPRTAVVASDLSSTSTSTSTSSNGSAAAAAAGGLVRVGSGSAVAAGMRQSRLDGRPSFKQLCSDLGAAAGHRVVWCSSFWRFLYLLTLNGLIFW
jgi:hypothetical protein